MAFCISNSALQWWKTSPRCLFGWNTGKENTDNSPQPNYHDIDLPFPLSLVSNTFLRGRELRCCYKATIDGFSATNFHGCCDFKGPCVIIGYTNKSFKFGAFNPEGYRSTDDYYDTFDAFLFYWKDNEMNDPIILRKVGGSGAALFDYARGGPQFGADGLLIGPPLAPVMGVFTGPDASSGVGDLRQAKSRLGLSYAKRADGKDSLFGDDQRAILEEELPMWDVTRRDQSGLQLHRASSCTGGSIKCLNYNYIELQAVLVDPLSSFQAQDQLTS